MTSKLTIQYDGTDFAGWARQPGPVRTVQAELERVLEILLPEPVSLTVAGRTDRGVHALAQVASYEGPPAPIAGLNALLAPDVAVLESSVAADGFDARRECTSRAYCYKVLARAARSPLDRNHVLHFNYPIDVDALDQCAAMLPGTHDFTAFTPADTYHVRFDRHVQTAYWRRNDGGLLEFWIEADTFMRHMNRILVGTMLAVARGRLSVEHFAGLLGGAPRTEAGPTAAPAGLYFAGAGYRGQHLLSAPATGA